MREKPPQIVGQESLIVSAPLTREFVVRDFEENWPAVSLTEHYLQQLHVLNVFSTLHEKEWMLRNPAKVARQYPKRQTEVLEATRSQWQQLQEEAKTEFFRSLGYFVVKDSGMVDDKELAAYTNDAERRWAVFQARFRSIPKAPARLAEIDSLLEKVKDSREGRTIYNRRYELRPHAPDKRKVRRQIEEETPAFRPLKPRERLLAIWEDPRAGYLPAHNREKNTILSWLDYFDNPTHPLGIGNQLLEVLVSQQKRQTPLEGIRAMESITWEVGDTIADAARAHELMSILAEDLEDIAPGVVLAEIEGLDEEAIRYLLRFEAVEHFAKTGDHSGLADVLRVKEDRQVLGGSDPGKHKTVHSHFTAPEKERPEETGDYIAQRISVLQAKEARTLLKRGIPNEFIRASVGVRCLADIQVSLAGMHRAFWPVREAVTKSLVAVKDQPIVKLILDERARQAA